eukprot:scaffold18245_cov72-Phaeocystis_antarctica.AAC.5
MGGGRGQPTTRPIASPSPYSTGTRGATCSRGRSLGELAKRKNTSVRTWCMVHDTGQAAVGEISAKNAWAPSSAVQQAYREVPARRQLRSGLRLPGRRSDGCPRAGRPRCRHRSQGMR